MSPHPIDDILEVEGSPTTQGTGEERSYRFRARGASSVTVPAITVFNGSGDNKTSIVMPVNTPTVSGVTISCSPLKSLDASDGPYRLVVKATVDANIWQRVLVIFPKDLALIGGA